MKKIWFVTTEAVPLAKTGGLADVCGTLPSILNSRGFVPEIIMPWYKTIEAKQVGRMMVRLGAENRYVRIGRIDLAGVEVKLIGAPQFFHREGLYGTESGSYADNDRRFIFFSRAATKYIQRQENTGLIHAHDWFTGLVPFYVKTRPELSEFASVFTIHNLRHQGQFAADSFRLTGLDWKHFSPQGVEYYGQLNLMKAGIVGADRITTVSPTYSREIQTQEFGEGLESVLRSRREDLTGIVNGIDTRTWNPEIDPYLGEEEKFGPEDMGGKDKVKTNLLDKFSLAGAGDEPLVGMVSRLAEQKGIRLLLQNEQAITNLPGRWLILGTGEPELEAGLKRLEKSAPGKIKVIIDFNEKLAHRIVAGSDLYCMPSRFEPCGLNQLYCAQYGTVPVVHRTGGLADTVVDVRETEDAGRATGFSFTKYKPRSFRKTLEAAMSCYHDQPEFWKQLQANGFEKDFSWEKSAEQYVEIYDSIS